MKPEQGTKLSKKAAAAKLKKLTKEGKASLLKVWCSQISLHNLFFTR